MIPRRRLAALAALAATLSWFTPAASQPRARDSDRFMALLVARSFFRALLSGNVDAALPLCARRVSFEGAQVQGTKQLRARLLKMAGRARAGGLKLKKVELLHLERMVERFGPPPARLKRSISPRDLIALARFNKQGALAVLRRDGRFWRISVLSD